MKTKEFNKLLKKHKSNPQEIIRMYCNNEIYITSRQFDKVLEARDGKRLKYENSVEDTDDSDNSGPLYRLWVNLTNNVRIKALQERLHLHQRRGR